MKKVQTFALIFIGLCSQLWGQQIDTISNVSFRQEGNTDILVFYDLEGTTEARYFVSLHWAEEGKAFSNALRRLEGDYGPVRPGKDKQIRWKAWQEIGAYQANSVVLKVQARVESISTAPGTSSNALRDLPWAPEMVLIRGGTFMMGSPTNEADRDENDETQHPVKLSDYYIGKYEVTVGDFKRFVDEENYVTDAEKGDGSYLLNKSSKWEKKAGISWRHDNAGNPRPENEYNHPVTHISWNDAQAYCKWLSRKSGQTYSLPTEAQWEYAARSRGKAIRYSWGNSAPTALKGASVADESGRKHFSWKNSTSNIFQNYDDKFITTAPVGSFAPNEAHVYDMSGNVWEWCQDYYDADYYQQCLAKGTVTDPPGPASGQDRVLRGGGCYSYPRSCRVAYRGIYWPTNRGSDIGFRLARSL